MSTPKEQPSGPPLRAIAMVLIALAIVFLGLGAASLGGSDSSETTAAESTTTETTLQTTTVARATTTPPPAPPAPPVDATPEPSVTVEPAVPVTTSTQAPTAPAVDPSAVSVRVLNNSTISGLAAGTAAELTASGWNVAETGNYSEGTVSSTTVFYGTSAGEKEAAEKIAAELGVSAQPRFEGIVGATPGVIVIVTSN
ncbi:hypothetical protein ABH922_003586 [Rhodococcus sp. 27YEA15]|uniref:LytR C-terminal domain-containing protein n=1 Tax=Rhodococcus sp. 27YEA15 TaxID=3156259 RepID=UPI003C7A6CB5